MMENQKINLTLTLGQVNGIMQALGNMPFVQVVDLINEVRSQASGQVQMSQPMSEATTETSIIQ
jgi:hypothetical protein